MISPLHSRPPPYELPSNIIYFHDWRYVSHGRYRWFDSDGKWYPLMVVQEHPPLHYKPDDLPMGIELIAQPATKTEPFAIPAMEDICVYAGSVFYDEGRYRWWCDCWPTESLANEPQGPVCEYVRYSESDNGFDWTQPQLGLIERFGSTANNIVYGPPLTGENYYHGGCVFKDPAAPPAERYKAFYAGRLTTQQHDAFMRDRPQDAATELLKGLFGAVSPDGLGWTKIDDPLVMVGSDTQNMCSYDVSLQQYVAYTRSWLFNRRSIGRMSTSDFRRFPLHEEVFWPNAMSQPDETWYTNAKTQMPGTTDYHVMFPMRWRATDDSFEFHLASSPDNVMWGFVPGGAVCKPGNPGAWDGGVVTPGMGLVELPGDRMGIMIFATPVPHKHPRRPPFGGFAWACWPKGRLVALHAESEGSFALWPLNAGQRSIELNVKTAPAGYVRVEVTDKDRNPLPGRRFEDCDPIGGDHLATAVTWRGQTDLGHDDDAPFILRFRMRSADLYSIEFR